ncbi:MAG TPA: hypothetical protein VMF08_05940 [Candidatus Sulfotelmatobacter sp.]|nr:hypothetical protein [Candidatus Sulfotelmatobacter sp.]
MRRRTISGFGNPRYGRFGNLRYGDAAASPCHAFEDPASLGSYAGAGEDD